jgi:hypothetical protein
VDGVRSTLAGEKRSSSAAARPDETGRGVRPEHIFFFLPQYTEDMRNTLERRQSTHRLPAELNTRPKLRNYAQIHVGALADVPKKPGWIRIVCIGDTFGEVLGKVPKCDIFIHTGNYTTPSTLEIDQFLRDLKDIDAGHKLIIPGEVEEYVLADLAVVFNASGAIFLNGGYITLEGLKITSASYIGMSSKVAVFPFSREGDAY